MSIFSRIGSAVKSAATKVYSTAKSIQSSGKTSTLSSASKSTSYSSAPTTTSTSSSGSSSSSSRSSYSGGGGSSGGSNTDPVSRPGYTTVSINGQLVNVPNNQSSIIDVGGKSYAVTPSINGGESRVAEVRSSGGGSSSSPSNIQASSKMLTTIDVAKDPTIKEAAGVLKTTVETKGVSAAVRQAPGLLYNAIFKPTQSQRNAEEKLNREAASRGTRVIYNPSLAEGGTIPADRRIPGGTAELKFVQVPDKQLLRDAKLGDDASLVAYKNRKEGDITARATFTSYQLRNEDVKQVSNLKTKLEADVASGTISVDQANQRIKDLATSLDASRPDRVAKVIQPEVDQVQKNINDAAKKGKVTKIAIGAAETFALGAVTGAALGTLPKVVQTGAAVAGGAGLAYQTTTLAKDFSTGKAGAIDVAGFAVGTGAFFAGAAFGGKVFNKGVDSVKLNAALRNSDIIVNTKGIITEASLKRLEIPADAKANLKFQIEGGATLRKIDVKLRPTSTSDQAIIEKELPYRNIQFVEVTDRLGNVIDRVAIGQVKIEGRTGKVFKQDIISRGNAYLTPEGTIEGTTLTAIGRAGKGIEKAIFTAETTTPESAPTKKGVVRIVKTNTGIRLVEAVEGKGRPLTMRELKDLVIRSEGEQGTKISEAQFVEIQRRTGLKFDAIIANAQALTKREDIFFGRGTGISTRFLETPLEPKASKTKTPFSETFKQPDITENLKSFENIGKNNKVQTNKIKSETAKIMKEISPSPANLEPGIRASIEQGAKQVYAPEEIAFFSPRNDVVESLRNFQKNNAQLDLSVLMKKSNIDILKLNKILDNSLINSEFNQIIQQGEIQVSNLDVNQILKQPQIQIPSINTNIQVPEVPIIDIPTNITGGGYGRNMDAGLKRLNMQLNKRIKDAGKYTASLSAVVGDVGIKVSSKDLDKQLKKLASSEFTGLEVRPLIEVIPSSKKRGRKKKR